jgi:hypothetical protein
MTTAIPTATTIAVSAATATTTADSFASLRHEQQRASNHNGDWNDNKRNDEG